ncbi:hypothetical protein LIER_39080 [Lithospermum erythrorhizon]|uniref:Uncharacterized protein n=1 Tax=Lithospermum erythrorhizon TaxID=34254 RepID=A0AAV3QAR4_LITER
MKGEGLNVDVPTRFTPHLKSTRVLSRPTKHKADLATFTTYWGTHPIPLQFYRPGVLKAAGLTPGSDADLGALQALRATYNVSDHVPTPHPAIPATCSDQQPLRLFAPNAARLVMVSNSSEEDEVTGPLLRRPSPSSGGPPVMGPSDVVLGPQGIMDGTSQGSSGNHSSSPLLPPWKGKGSSSPADLVSVATLALADEYSATVVLEPQDRGEGVRLSPSASKGLPASKKSGIPSCQSTAAAILKESPAPPAGGSSMSKRSAEDPNQKERISSFFALGDKASGSSFRVGHLEHELKTLKRETSPEEGVLQRRLTNLTVEHSTLQERCATRIRRTKAVRAELEGVQANRDFAQLERDSLKKERESLCACRDEALQSNDRLLCQLKEIHRLA